MDLPYKSFLKIAKQAQILSKHVNMMDVSIDKTNEYVDGQYVPTVKVAYTNLHFDSVADMHAYAKYLPIPTHKLKIGNDIRYKDLEANIAQRAGWDNTHIMRGLGHDTAKGETSVKLIPEETLTVFRPNIIKLAPVEYTEGDYTYRILTSQSTKNYTARIRVIARNDEPIYDYLDKGFFVMTITEKSDELTSPAFVVSDSYDVNTAHIFMMCKMQPNLVSMLKDECFASKYDAEMTKLKMLRKLTPEAKVQYLKQSKTIDEDYRKNTTLVVVGKLIAGEIEKTTVRDVTFSATTAKYENTEIEAEDLMTVLSRNLDFNGEFDIYAVVQLYTNYVKTCLATKSWNYKKIDDIKAGANELKQKSVPTFKINGISISAAVSYSGQRYVNNIRINHDEVSTAMHRASCYRSAEDYSLFLKSISRMSLKRHDIIANGLQVKIHAGMTIEEFRESTPGVNAPALKFVIDKQDKRIKLYIDENRQVPVDISGLIKKVQTINSKTNNRAFYDRSDNAYHYINRDHIWAAKELTKALIEFTTFPVKFKNMEDGTEVEKDVVMISKEDVTKLLRVVEEQNKAKIERSKQFLSTAVKLTGAEEIEFLGEKAYKVKGNLREYAVVIKTAKVYDYETKQYRCIVNDRHYKGAGYDDVASRLLALKNDSVMQDQIGTLRGAAQPGAENAHNDYRPERDVQDIIAPMVDKAFEKV
jgi:hypothetical protein